MDFFTTRASTTRTAWSGPFWQRVWDANALEEAMQAPRATQEAKLFDILARNAANCYIVTPPDCTQLRAGDIATVLLA